MVQYGRRRRGYGTRKRRGVKSGYRHIWKYKGVWNEKKKNPRMWLIDFKATKGKKSKSYGNFKKGFKIHWRIIADQYATKTNKGKYQTRMVGKKYLIHSGYGRKFRKDHRRYKKY